MEERAALQNRRFQIYNIALVDVEDYERVNKYKWQAISYGKEVHAGRSDWNKGKQQHIKMSRFILNASKGKVVDHINHLCLDNRKCNLRLCTNAQNLHNQRSRGGTSKYKGVYWNKLYKKWYASIAFQGKRKQLGSFTDEALAAKAYDERAKELFGEFACLNFPACQEKKGGE